MTKRGNYGDERNMEKPGPGEAKPGAERPDGKPQKDGGAQPRDIRGENRQTPDLQPGRPS